MKVFLGIMLTAAATVCLAPGAMAQKAVTGEWVKREPVKPDPSTSVGFGKRRLGVDSVEKLWVAVVWF